MWQYYLKGGTEGIHIWFLVILKQEAANHMKYFTKKLWADIQNEKKYEETRDLWDSAVSEYHKQFEGLKSRLPADVYEIYKQYSLHDSKIVSLEAVNHSPIKRSNKLKRSNKSICVTLKISIDDNILIFEYKNVTDINFKYSVENQKFEDINDDLGYIGYDELTEKNKNYLRHEFLLSTGNIIEIIFKNVKVFLGQ